MPLMKVLPLVSCRGGAVGSGCFVAVADALAGDGVVARRGGRDGWHGAGWLLAVNHVNDGLDQWPVRRDGFRLDLLLALAGRAGPPFALEVFVGEVLAAAALAV